MVFRTYSGKRIDFAQPIKAEDIEIEDIANGLIKLCRFSGQCYSFYSVAQHSLHVSALIRDDGGSPVEQLAGLLHDASEAYIADLPSPAKLECPDYLELETNMMKAICERFSLPFPLPAHVWAADREALQEELKFLFLDETKKKPSYAPTPLRALGFLARFKALVKEIKGGRKKVRSRKNTAKLAPKTSACRDRKST